MATDASALVKIVADIAGLKTGMNEAVSTVKNTATKIHEAMDGVQSTFVKFNATLLTIMAALKGGEMFKESIESAKEMTGETMKLSRMLGMTVGDASDLRTALGDAYITVDEFAGANAKLSMKLKENESNMNEMGVQTRDANGRLLEQKTIFMNAVDALRTYKEGTDRNSAAMELFGRSGAEALKFLKLNSEKIDEAKKKNEELNLTITEKNVAAYGAYRDAMNDAGDVMDGIQKAISEAVMPRLTEMAKWFAEIGPQAVEATRIAMASFYVILDSIKLVIKGFYYELLTASEGLQLFGKIAYDVFTMDWDNISTDWNNGLAEINKNIVDRANDIIESAKKIKTGFDFNMDKGKASDMIVGEGGTKGYTPSKDAEKEGKTLTKQFEDELAQRKLAQGAFNEFSKAQELSFWQEKLAIVAGMGDKFKAQYLDIHKKVAELSLAAQKESLAKEIDTLQFKIALERDNLDKQAELYTQIFEKIAKVYKEDTKEYRQALLDKINADRDASEKSIELLTEAEDKISQVKTAALERMQDDVDTYANMGLISETKRLEETRDIEEQKYQIKLDFLRKEQEMNAGNVERLRQINNEVQASQIEHANKMHNINNQLLQADYAQWKTFGDNVENSMADAFKSMIWNGKSFADAMRSFGSAILQSFVEMLSKMVAQWVMSEVIKTNAMILWENMRAGYRHAMGIADVGSTTAKETTKTAIESANAGTRIGIAAGEAGAKATAKGTEVVIHNTAEAEKTGVEGTFSLARIGIAMGEMFAKLTAFYAFLGPAAPVAAGVTVAAVGAAAFSMVNKAMKSASGGYDIPSGVNPVTQLHQEEMVLPAHIANPLRESLANGGVGSGGSTNITIHAVDAKSVKQLFTDHGSALVDALKGQKRAFAG